jgi:nitroreductase
VCDSRHDADASASNSNKAKSIGAAMIETSEQKIIDAALMSRRSIRAFLSTPVARDDIEAILQVAARAPSGTNTQPWKVYILTGEKKEKLSAEILNAYRDPALSRQHIQEYHYYPREWVSPYIDRRRKIGWDLYSLLGITRNDKTKMQAQHGRNYVFFDAPVGMIFTIDRVMELGSWLDYGMFLQNIMIAARGRGLDTCPQAAFTQYHKIISDVLGLPDGEQVVCGMSLGYADPARIENTLLTEREPVSGFAKFLD